MLNDPDTNRKGKIEAIDGTNHRNFRLVWLSRLRGSIGGIYDRDWDVLRSFFLPFSLSKKILPLCHSFLVQSHSSKYDNSTAMTVKYSSFLCSFPVTRPLISLHS